MNLPNVLLLRDDESSGNSAAQYRRQILAHEKTRLYISHFSADNAIESLYSGTPMLAIAKDVE